MHNVGDDVTIIGSHRDVTAGKVYQVKRAHAQGIEIVDDAGDSHLILNREVAKVLYKRAASSTAAFKAQYQHDPYALDAGEDEQEDYDTRKKNASVTSVGSFEKGDKVVYKDGTPIPTEYGFFRVKSCTATAVWFEHCYSMPFNPTEFKRA